MREKDLIQSSIAKLTIPFLWLLGKPLLVSSVYPKQLEFRSALFDGIKTRENPESTNHR